MSRETTKTQARSKGNAPPPRQISGGRTDKGDTQLEKVKPAGALATADDAALLAEDSRAGMENIGTRDLAIPRLKLLQDLSPECKKKESTYIPDAEAGDFYDSVNDVLIKGEEGFEAILVAYRSSYLEFIPRKKGGGYVADHGSAPNALLASVTKGEKGEMILPNKNELVLVAEYLALILDPETGAYRMTLVGMAKSQLRHSRQLNTWITTLKVPDGKGGTMTPAIFYRTYKFTSSPEKNKTNDTWMGFSITPGEPVLGLGDPFDGRQLYLACRDIRKDFDANKIKVQPPTAPVEEPAGGANSDEPM